MRVRRPDFPLTTADDRKARRRRRRLRLRRVRVQCAGITFPGHDAVCRSTVTVFPKASRRRENAGNGRNDEIEIAHRARGHEGDRRLLRDHRVRVFSGRQAPEETAVGRAAGPG